MRLRLFDRLRRMFRRITTSLDPAYGRHGQQRPARQPPAGQSPVSATAVPVGNGTGAHARPSSGAAGHPGGAGGGRARIREAPFGSAPVEAIAEPQATARARPGKPRQPWYQAVEPPAGSRESYPPALAREAALTTGSHPGLAAGPEAAAQPGLGAVHARDLRNATAQARAHALPFVAPHPQGRASSVDGRTNCGPLERILWRQWEDGTTPPPQVRAAIERLATFPRALQDKLAVGLTGIFVGAGGVPDLDHMTELRGVPLPGGRATWDACAGAYGERKIVVGSRPSPTPDVMCHEVGHALDDLDSPPGRWQSDLAEFRLIYDQCQPYLASDFHIQRGGLGRKEFFADAFAAIASGQRPALVDMLSGNTRVALRVMLYFNRRYGI